MKFLKKWREERSWRPVLYLLIALAFGVMGYFLYFFSRRLLHGDLSSELVLGNLLAKEGKVITDSWFYSTEVRVFNTQLVYAPLFKVLKDWTAVRTVANLIMYLFLVLALFYLMRELGLKKYAPWLGLFAVLPFSHQYMEYVLLGAYYLPHITVSALLLALQIHLLRLNRGSDIKYLLLFFSFTLSLLAGMGGLRQLLVLHIPLICASLLLYFVHDGVKIKRVIEGKEKFSWDKYSYNLILALATGFFAGVGLIINRKVISEFVRFNDYNELMFQPFQLDNLSEVLNGFFATFGYKGFDTVFGKTLINNAFAFVLIAFLTWGLIALLKKTKTLSFRKQLITHFYAFGLLIFTALYLYTDMVYMMRYGIPIAVFGFLIMFLYVDEWDFSFGKKSMVLLLALSVFVTSVTTLADYRKADRTADIRAAISVLDKEGIDQGYATFWQGNTFTELTSGEIEVWVQTHDQPITSADQTFQWLQKVSHETEKPSGRFFYYLLKDEIPKVGLSQVVEGAQVLYESDKAILYCFDSYEDFAQRFSSQQ